MVYVGGAGTVSSWYHSTATNCKVAFRSILKLYPSNGTSSMHLGNGVGRD